MRNKKGISLIVLVITILIMIILAGSIIVTLTNQGIIEQAENAVGASDIAEVQSLAELKWSEAYTDGKRTQEELEQAVIDGIKKELGEEIIEKYSIVVNDEGVDVYGFLWLTSIVDTVPIPKGFVASQAAGENTKSVGLVIYEGTEPVTNANVEIAKRTRNQYVWVPVEEFESEFVRQNFGTDYTISNTLGENIWEVALDTATNMPLATQDTNYMTSTTLAEVQAMYESVKKYKGFYIARYESGIDTQRTNNDGALVTNVYSIMGKIPYTYIPWGNSVEVARSIYPKTNTDYGVVSTLIYGVQWDRTLAWWVETKAQNATKTVTIVSNDNLNNSALRKWH